MSKMEDNIGGETRIFDIAFGAHFYRSMALGVHLLGYLRLRAIRW